jgi:hypothetical protein
LAQPKASFSSFLTVVSLIFGIQCADPQGLGTHRGNPPRNRLALCTIWPYAPDRSLGGTLL